jgi:hypothetical protein
MSAWEGSGMTGLVSRATTAVRIAPFGCLWTFPKALQGLS